VAGTKSCHGSSAYKRASTECPDNFTSAWENANGSPDAIAIWSATRSTASHELGDRMFDLKSRVQLEEVELAVASEQELGGSGAGIAGGPGERRGRFAEASAEGRIDHWRRCFLDDLLVTTLKRAFALAEVHDVPVRVPEQLHLDVARPGLVALENKPIVAERPGGFAASAGDGVAEVLGSLEHVHPFAAAARARLDEDRKADAARLAQQFCVRLVVAVVTGQYRHSSRDRGPAAPRPSGPMIRSARQMSCRSSVPLSACAA